LLVEHLLNVGICATNLAIISTNLEHYPIRQAARCLSFLTPLLVTLSLLLAASIAFAAVTGDQVELKATHQAGVPFHNAPGGTPKFQRVPTGTIATVMDIAREGRWLQIRLPDHRTGWIVVRYVGRTIAGSPPPATSAERLVWTPPEGCQQVVGSGGRMAPANPATLRVGTWNIPHSIDFSGKAPGPSRWS
jgi:hypothetical protein